MFSCKVNLELEQIIAASLNGPAGKELHIANFGDSIEELLQENVPTESLNDFLDLLSAKSISVIKETRRRTTALVFESRIAVTAVQGARSVSIPSCLEWEDLVYELSDPPIVLRVHHDRGATDVAATVSDVKLDAASQCAKFTCRFQLDLADLVAECSVTVHQTTNKQQKGAQDWVAHACRGTADISAAED